MGILVANATIGIGQEVRAKLALDRLAGLIAIRAEVIRDGERVEVPQAGPGEGVFARIDGAAVSGLESLRSLLYRAKLRYATVNDGRRSRLVPGTDADGLLMNGPPVLVGSGPFEQAPQAHTIELTGPSGDLRYDFYSMSVEPTAAERAAARAER